MLYAIASVIRANHLVLTLAHNPPILAMTPAEISLTLKAMQKLLLRNELGPAVDKYAMPVSVYLQDRFFLFRDQVALKRAIDIYRRILVDEGITRIDPTVLSIEDISDQRVVSRVRLCFWRADRSELTPSELRYVHRRGETTADLKIEMVEYLSLGFHDYANQLEALQTT